LSIAYQGVSARLQYGLQYMGSRQRVLGMRFGASARGSRGGRRACLPELQGTNRRQAHSSCEGVRCYSHYSRDSESIGCHVAEGMGM
jgi:hypothetical protein